MLPLLGLPIITSEFLTETKTQCVSRTFRPGARKGRHAHRRKKIYFYVHTTVPSQNVLMMQGCVVVHPAMYDELIASLRKINSYVPNESFASIYDRLMFVREV